MRRSADQGYPLIEAPNPTEPYRPHTSSFLNQLYGDGEPRLPAPSTKNPSAWRRNLRNALRRILRLDALGKPPIPVPDILDQSDRDGYCRQRIAYETVPGNWVSAYLLVPLEGGCGPAVICPHGHVEGGKEGVIDPHKSRGTAYGHALARRGCVVLAPDNAGMGARDGSSPVSDKPGGCMLA